MVNLYAVAMDEIGSYMYQTLKKETEEEACAVIVEYSKRQDARSWLFKDDKTGWYYPNTKIIFFKIVNQTEEIK